MSPPPESDLGLTDPGAVAQVAAPGAFLLRDARDVPLLRPIARMSATLVPAALALFALPAPWVWVCAVPYLVWMGQCAAPYVLLLHNVVHRPPFRPAHRWLDAWTKWVLGPLVGLTPHTYVVHHMSMHHVEDNTETDLSGTGSYERDNWRHFLLYWARFAWLGHLHLPRYLVARGRWRALRAFVLGEAAWLAALVALLWLRPAATVVVFVLPMLILRFFLMAGNWAQHAFLDPTGLRHPLGGATCIVDSPYNHRCFNDGYHAIHHWRPGLHWTECPDYFRAHLPALAARGTAVFRGLRSNQAVWSALLRHDYDLLADHLVDLGPARTHAEKVAWLKAHARATFGPPKGLFELRESPLGKAPAPPGRLAR